MGKLSKDKRDIYYRKAKELGYRARSAFKLIQIHEKLGILDNVKYAVDLCSAPGSWCQVLAERLWLPNEDKSSEVRIIGVDIQEMAPIDGVFLLQGDITAEKTTKEIISLFKGNKADIVISDGAPDVTGLHDIDEYIQGQLILSALNIATYLLKPGGNFVAKIFRGKDVSLLYSQFECFFETVTIVKPQSSRNTSIEAFVVGLNFNPNKIKEVDCIKQLKADEPNSLEPLEGLTYGLESIPDFPQYKHAVKFISCGDLSGYDADKNYPLDDEKEYIGPVQPPINPSYSEALAQKNSN